MGLALFFLLHLFHRVDNALVRAFHHTSLFQLDMFLSEIAQYLLPLLLWLAVVIRRPIGKPSRTKDQRADGHAEKKYFSQAPPVPVVKAP